MKASLMGCLFCSASITARTCRKREGQSYICITLQRFCHEGVLDGLLLLLRLRHPARLRAQERSEETLLECPPSARTPRKILSSAPIHPRGVHLHIFRNLHILVCVRAHLAKQPSYFPGHVNEMSQIPRQHAGEGCSSPVRRRAMLQAESAHRQPLLTTHSHA